MSEQEKQTRIRLECLSQAIRISPLSSSETASGSSKTVTAEQILETAKKFEDYVFSLLKVD